MTVYSVTQYSPVLKSQGNGTVAPQHLYTGRFASDGWDLAVHVLTISFVLVYWGKSFRPQYFVLRI